MTSHGIRRIERLNYIIGGLGIIVAALTVPQKPAYSLAIGVVLTCLNFAALRFLVFRWTSAVKAGNDAASSNRILLVLPKMFLLMGAVALVVLLLPIEPISFLIGFSVFLPSIAVATALEVVSPGPPDPDPQPPAGGAPPSTPPSETHG